MSYDVRFIKLEEIPDDNEHSWMKGGYDDGFTSYLGIFVDGKLADVQCDGGEPEDNSFGRDWSWVVGELIEAYKKGVEDGRTQTNN